MSPRVTIRWGPWPLLFLLVLLGDSDLFFVQSQDRNLDQFNYDTTVVDSVHSDFGPEDWGQIQCPDLETCVSKTWTRKRRR
jgi:hypothetical protein